VPSIFITTMLQGMSLGDRATKLTSFSLQMVRTESQQADVVSVLTALPDLEQLAWWSVECGRQRGLTDSMMLPKLTKLTALRLDTDGAAEALEHLGLLTGLQDLSLAVLEDWAAAGCFGLQELKALTRLELVGHFVDVTPTISQLTALTALQELDVPCATPTALNKLSALTGLTRLYVVFLEDLWPNSPPLELSGLLQLVVCQGNGIMPMWLLECCKQLQVLELCEVKFSPDSLADSCSTLQHMELLYCRLCASGEEDDPFTWQEVFSGPGQLPHLTSLQLADLKPDLQLADMECVVACCSTLQVLQLGIVPDNIASALGRLSGLTTLALDQSSDQQCGSPGQLTWLRELKVDDASEVFAAGLQQLAALEQLTSLGLNCLGCSSAVLRERMSDRLPGPRRYEYLIINKVCGCVWGKGGTASHYCTQFAVVLGWRAG